MVNKVYIHTDYITLGQLLKFENIVESGGHVKDFLSTETIYVNDVLENRRGKKLYPNDVIKIINVGTFEISYGDS